MISRMIPFVLIALTAVLAHADDPAAIGRGNMHFDAKAMDANGDGMISKEELMRYGETMWVRMARAANVKISVADAARNFARGNLRFDAKAVDADGDGQITKEEFMKYGEAKFDSMKQSKGMISVSDAAKNFGRGNQRLD
jgi:Ca2+-binding EF-hand superfamily protein